MKKSITLNYLSHMTLAAACIAAAFGCEGDTIYYITGDPNPDSSVETDSGKKADSGVDADTDTAQPMGDIVIGMMDPGLDNDTGPLPRAFQLAINEAIAAGGLLGGRTITTEIAEEPRFEAGSNIRSLVEAGASVIVGPANTNNAFEAIPILVEAEIPFYSIYGGASADFKNPYGVSPFWVPADSMAPPAAQIAADRAECTSAGFASVRDISDAANARIIEIHTSAVTGAGMEYSGSILVDFQPADITTELSDAFSADPPDCLLLDSPLAAIVLRDLPDELASTKLVLMDGLIPPLLMGVVESLADLNGVFGVQPQFLHPERNQAYVERYAAVFGEELAPQMHFFMSNVYDATALFLLAIEAAGTTDGEAIREALNQVGADSPGAFVVEPNEIGAGLAAIRNGQAVNYQGATGSTDYSEGDSWPAKGPVSCYVVTDADNFQVGECP